MLSIVPDGSADGAIANRVGYTDDMATFDAWVETTMLEKGDRFEALVLDLIALIEEVYREQQRTGGGLDCIVAHRKPPRKDVVELRETCPMCALIYVRSLNGKKPKGTSR